MSAATIVARQHVVTLARRKTFLLMLGVLLLMTAVSGLIGWLSHRTITQVFEETARTLQAAGKAIPPNPFADKPRLAILNNMVIYIPLVGALLAIVIGHLGVTSDRHAGVMRIIFSRPVKRSSYLWGKLTGSAIAGAAIMAACCALSVVALTLINGSFPTGAELVRLSLFYAISGLYLLLFMLVGMVASLLTRSSSMALFVAIGVWVALTFAMPQFTSGLRPVASLNPITDPVSTTNSTFFRLTSKAKPIAVNEQYKALATRVLTAGSAAAPGTTARQLAPIAGFTLLLGMWAGGLIRRRNVSEESSDD